MGKQQAGKLKILEGIFTWRGQQLGRTVNSEGNMEGWGNDASNSLPSLHLRSCPLLNPTRSQKAKRNFDLVYMDPFSRA